MESSFTLLSTMSPMISKKRILPKRNKVPSKLSLKKNIRRSSLGVASSTLVCDVPQTVQNNTVILVDESTTESDSSNLGSNSPVIIVESTFVASDNTSDSEGSLLEKKEVKVKSNINQLFNCDLSSTKVENIQKWVENIDLRNKNEKLEEEKDLPIFRKIGIKNGESSLLKNGNVSSYQNGNSKSDKKVGKQNEEGAFKNIRTNSETTYKSTFFTPLKQINKVPASPWKERFRNICDSDDSDSSSDKYLSSKSGNDQLETVSHITERKNKLPKNFCKGIFDEDSSDYSDTYVPVEERLTNLKTSNSKLIQKKIPKDSISKSSDDELETLLHTDERTNKLPKIFSKGIFGEEPSDYSDTYVPLEERLTKLKTTNSKRIQKKIPKDGISKSSDDELETLLHTGERTNKLPKIFSKGIFGEDPSDYADTYVPLEERLTKLKTSRSKPIQNKIPKDGISKSSDNELETVLHTGKRTNKLPKTFSKGIFGEDPSDYSDTYVPLEERLTKLKTSHSKLIQKKIPKDGTNPKVPLEERLNNLKIDDSTCVQNKSPVSTKKKVTKARKKKTADSLDYSTSALESHSSDTFFLASLSELVPLESCDPSAKIFRNNYKQYKNELAVKLFKLYNENVFKDQLPKDTPIEWSERMSRTAGFCYCKKITRSTGSIERKARIALSSKVLDTADRLRDTLIHEMCHAAAWIVNQVADGHGSYWRFWTNKVRTIFPELPAIKVCHNYKINSKYTYRCTSCGYSFGRQKKSFVIERKRCGYCYGTFEVLLNKTTKTGEKKTIPATPKKEATGFALFVKENYALHKIPERSHKEVMVLLGQQFSAKKATAKKIVYPDNDNNCSF